ncbi:CvfB family protein [Aquimarina agarilytica]|uniref:CvfB family protein n=1 Tax=Aquimarina agarilytica TaxID=1087449 RepID=UPI000288630B|nr:S1-like domain-containing RNA-binding protein [Aquimarina agarilytica]
MISIGTYHVLTIDRERLPGIYLTNEDGDEVLLPNKYVPETFEVGGSIKVFTYLDHMERIVATTLEPFATVNSFAFLKCAAVSEIGAFLDWGLEKHLFVPFKEQANQMKVGRSYLVYVYLDEKTERLVGSSKTNRFLSNKLVLLSSYEEVDLIASHPSDKGWNMIINQKYLGLVYDDEIFQKINVGDRMKGFVKKVRSDNKIDLTLQRHGYRSIEPNADLIIRMLKAEGGFLALNDKSSPEKIKDILQLSKKNFKKAIGTLYKQRLIKIEPDGISLVE